MEDNAEKAVLVAHWNQAIRKGGFFHAATVPGSTHGKAISSGFFCSSCTSAPERRSGQHGAPCNPHLGNDRAMARNRIDEEGLQSAREGALRARSNLAETSTSIEGSSTELYRVLNQF